MSEGGTCVRGKPATSGGASHAQLDETGSSRQAPPPPQHRISTAGKETMGSPSPSSASEACSAHISAASPHAQSLARDHDYTPPLARCPRTRLASHQLQVAGSVEIPDAWCGEARLREWASSDAVEAALRPPDLGNARAALVSHSRRSWAPSRWA